MTSLPPRAQMTSRPLVPCRTSAFSVPTTVHVWPQIVIASAAVGAANVTVAAGAMTSTAAATPRVNRCTFALPDDMYSVLSKPRLRDGAGEPRKSTRSGHPSTHRQAEEGSSEGVRGRLPLLEALRDELGALFLAAAVHDLEVRRVGAEVDAGGPRVQAGVAIRPRRPVAGGAVRALHLDLSGALELRRVRVSRTLAFPV